MWRIRRPLSLIFISALLIAGCSDDTTDDGYLSLTPDDAEFELFPHEFADFPLYWVGKVLGERELRYVIRDRDNSVAFIYGTCEIEGDEGCSPPLQIVVEQFCLASPPAGFYGRPASLPTIRGGAELQVAEQGGGVLLWTGGVTVRIWSQDAPFEDVVDVLVSPNGLGVQDVGSPLPAPEVDCGKLARSQVAAG